MNEGFKINDIRVTPTDGEVWRNGAQVGILRPKAMAVLVALASSPNKVVSRDELMATVWPGRVISEDTLTSYLSEIRRALGENAKSQSLVQTVAKRGYRLAATVTTPLPDEENEVPRRRVWAAVGAAVIVAGLVSAFTFTSLPDAEPTIVVAEFAVTTDADEATTKAATRYERALRDRLHDVDGVRLRGGFGGLTAGEFIAETGGYVVSGEVTADSVLGDRMVLTVTVNHANRLGMPVETPLGQFDIPSSESAYFVELPRIRDEIVERIKARLGKLIGVDRGQLRSTTNAEAYRLFLLAGERQVESPACGEATQPLLQRALEIDPEFADAWNLLGYAHWTAMWSCGNGRRAAELAVQAADKALSIDPSHHSAVYLKTNVLVQTGRFKEALRSVDGIMSEQGGSPYLYASLSTALRYAGLVDEAAMAARNAIELDSQVYLASLYEAPLALLYAGDVEGYRAQMPNIDDSMTDFYAAYSMLVLRQPERATDSLAVSAERRLTESGTFAELASVLHLIMSDQPGAAIDRLEQHILERQIRGAVDGEVTFKQAQLFALADAPDRAIERLGVAADEGFVCLDCASRDPTLSTLTSEPGYQRLLDRLQRERVFVDGLMGQLRVESLQD